MAKNTEYRELLLGCGHRREKDIITPNGREFRNLTTLDMYAESGADVIFNLDALSITNQGRLPFEDNTFDEIAAYDVLEHINHQGDYESFFYEFREYFRVIKNGGLFCATVPNDVGPHTWGDPGHRRVINDLSLVYLSRKAVMEQLGKTTITDYLRYSGDMEFQCVHLQPGKDRFGFVLKAVK